MRKRVISILMSLLLVSGCAVSRETPPAADVFESEQTENIRTDTSSMPMEDSDKVPAGSTVSSDTAAESDVPETAEAETSEKTELEKYTPPV